MEKLSLALQAIQEHGLDIYSVTEIWNGESKTVNVRENAFSNTPICRNVYSVSKAFTMAAVGFLWDEKKLRLDDTLGDVFGTLPEGSDPKWAEVTIEDLLLHKTGYEAQKDSIQATDLDGCDLRQYTKGDWLAFILGRPITGKHGVDGSYTDTGFYVLSRVVAKIAGVPMQDYMREKLFNPLQVRDWAWFACPLGHAYGGTGLVISSTDLAKLGQLWLQKGKWDGKQILSEEWIRYALERPLTFYRLRGDHRNVFCKTGMRGQRLIFSYDENRVIAILSYTREIDKVEDALYPKLEKQEETP